MIYPAEPLKTVYIWPAQLAKGDLLMGRIISDPTSSRSSITCYGDSQVGFMDNPMRRHLDLGVGTSAIDVSAIFLMTSQQVIRAISRKELLYHVGPSIMSRFVIFVILVRSIDCTLMRGEVVGPSVV